MYIASFDVGLRNLAFCIFNCENKRHKIIRWDVIHIQDKGLKTITCDVPNCHGSAAYENYFGSFCVLHKSIKKRAKPGTGVCKSMSCNCKALYRVTRKINLCDKHTNTLDEYQQRIMIETKDFSKVSKSLVKRLNTIEELNLCSVFLVETQPKMFRGMTILSAFLFQYLNTRGAGQYCKFVPPVTSLYKNSFSKNRRVKNRQETYKQRKQMSIDKAMLCLRGKWINHINEYKKKDDMCESLLQGHYFCPGHKHDTTIVWE